MLTLTLREPNELFSTLPSHCEFEGYSGVRTRSDLRVFTACCLSGSNWTAAAFCAVARGKGNMNGWERGQVGGECVCAFVYVCVYGRGLRWGMQIRPPLIKGRNTLLEAPCRNHSARILWRRKFRNEICREGGSRTPRYNLAERGEGGWLADVGCGTRRCLLLRCWSISPASDWPFKDYLGSLQEKLC